MARVKAITSFAGIVTMGAGEVRNITDESIVEDLVNVGYVEILEGAADEVPEGAADEVPEGAADEVPEGAADEAPEEKKAAVKTTKSATKKK